MTENKPTPPLDTRLALRAKEAAAALGISERKLRDVAPRLPSVWLDGVRLFPVEALREWLRTEAREQAQCVEAEADHIVRSLRRVPKTEDTAES